MVIDYPIEEFTSISAVVYLPGPVGGHGFIGLNGSGVWPAEYANELVPVPCNQWVTIQRSYEIPARRIFMTPFLNNDSLVFFGVDNFVVTVPEPNTVALCALGIGLLVAKSRKRRNQALDGLRHIPVKCDVLRA